MAEYTTNDEQGESARESSSLSNGSVSESLKPSRKRRFKLSPKVRRPLLVLGILAIIAGLAACSYTLYKKTNLLSEENKNLNSTIDGYKTEKAAPDKLTDSALQSVTEDIETQPVLEPGDDDTSGGVAIQVNVDDTESDTPKYVGGEYAPYWILAKYALTVPDGIKMVRTTELTTTGRLLTADDEGGAGCGGEGIYMSVGSQLSTPDGLFRAYGSSATYDRGLGCGGADPVIVVSAQYTTMPQINDYKYVELVTADCMELDENYNCVGTKSDKKKWRVYSGIILTSAPEFKVGEEIDGGQVARQLYNRDEYGIQFYMNCTSKEYGGFYCGAEDYKTDDYTTILKNASYIELRDIVLDMHGF